MYIKHSRSCMLVAFADLLSSLVLKTAYNHKVAMADIVKHVSMPDVNTHGLAAMQLVPWLFDNGIALVEFSQTCIDNDNTVIIDPHIDLASIVGNRLEQGAWVLAFAKAEGLHAVSVVDGSVNDYILNMETGLMPHYTRVTDLSKETWYAAWSLQIYDRQKFEDFISYRRDQESISRLALESVTFST